jgi:hypothetical protein
MRDNLLSTSTSSILLFAVFLTFSSSLCRGFFSSSFVRKLPYRQATTVFLGSYRGNNDVEGEKSMWDATAGNVFEGRIPATRKVASLTSSHEAAIKKAKSSQLNAAENGRGGGGINVKDDIAGDKLVWDSKAGRFFEAKIDGIQEEEFCLLDPTNGKSILLTREEKERDRIFTPQNEQSEKLLGQVLMITPTEEIKIESLYNTTDIAERNRLIDSFFIAKQMNRSKFNETIDNQIKNANPKKEVKEDSKTKEDSKKDVIKKDAKSVLNTIKETKSTSSAPNIKTEVAPTKKEDPQDIKKTNTPKTEKKEVPATPIKK